MSNIDIIDDLICRQFSVEQLREDFLTLRNLLEEGHPSIYCYRSKEQMDVKFDSTFDQINKPMTLFEFFKIIAPVISFIGDGHSIFSAPKKILDHVEQKSGLFPIKPVFIGGKLHVYRNYTDKGIPGIGCEITSIDNMAIEEICEQLFPFITIDGYGSNRKYRPLEEKFQKLFPTIFGMKSEYSIEYREIGNDSLKSAVVKTIPLNELKKIRQTKYPDEIYDPLFRLTFNDELKTAIIRLRSFLNAGPWIRYTGVKQYKNDGRLRKFLRNTFQQIKESKCKNLVIDIRNNHGGREDLVALTYSYLAREEFQFFEGLYLREDYREFLNKVGKKLLKLVFNLLKKEKLGKYGYKFENFFFMPQLYKIHKPKPNAFKGDIYVLINGNSFSAAGEFTTNCHRFKRVVFIGEETRAGYIGNAAGPIITNVLPHTKIIFRIPMFRYVLPVPQDQSDGHGTIPDHPVENKIEDVLNEIDTQLTYALNLIKKEARM